MTEGISSSTHPITGNNSHHQLPNFNVVVSSHGRNNVSAEEEKCDDGEQVNPQTISSTTYAWRIERHWFPLLRYIYFSNSEHPDGNVPHNHKTVQQQYADQPPQGAGAGASATTTKSRRDDDEGHVRLLQTTASTSDLNHHAASAFISVHEAEMSSVAPGGAMAGSSFAMHKGKKGTHNAASSFAVEGVQNSRRSLRTRVSPVTEAEFVAYFCSSRFNSLVDCFAASVFVAGGAVQYLVQDRTSLLPGIGNGAVAVAKLLLGIATWWVWKHQGREDNGGKTSLLDKLFLLFSFRSHRRRADASDADEGEYSEGETSASTVPRGGAATTVGKNGGRKDSSSSSQHHTTTAISTSFNVPPSTARRRLQPSSLSHHLTDTQEMVGESFALSGQQLASSIISISNNSNNRSNDSSNDNNPKRIINGSEIAATVHWLGSHPLDPHCPVRQHGRYNASLHERLIMLNTVLNVVFGIFNVVHECADPPNDPNDRSLFYRYPGMDHFCESTMQLQPLFLLGVLTTTNLSPLRAVILVPLYSVLLAVYFAIRWIPGVPYGTTAVQYWSLALIVSLETLGCIAISIVREVRARRRFEHHVERFLLCVQTERTRRKIESMADAQIPLVFLRHAIDKTKSEAQQQPNRRANHFGGDIPPYTFQNSRGVVCMFSIAGFGPWSSRRGPSDYIQVLQQVHEVYDRTLRELVRVFQSRVPPSAKKHSVIGKVKQQRKRSVLGTSSSSLKSPSLALLTGVPTLRVYKVHTLGDVFMLVGCYVQEHQVQQRASTAMTDADGSTTTVQQRRQFSGVTLSPMIAYESAVNPLLVPQPEQNALVQQQRSPQQNSLGPTATAAARRQSSSPREGSTPVVAPAIGDQAAQASQHLLVLPRSQSLLSGGQQDSASASGSYNPLMPETPQQLSSPRGGGGGGGGSGRASPLPMIATLKSPRSSAVAAPITDMNAVAIVGAGGGGGGAVTSTSKRLSLAQLEHQKQRQQHHEYQLQILVQRVCVALERVSNVLPEAVDGLEWQSIDSNEEASRLRPVAVVVEGAVGLTMHKDTKNVIGFGAGVDQATKLLKRVVIATYPSHQRSLFPNTDVPVGNLSTESAQTTSIGAVGIDRGTQRDHKLFPLPRGILVLRLSSSTVATDVCDDAGWLTVHKSPAATGTSAAEVVVPSGIGSSSLRGTGGAHNSTRHLSIISQLGPGGSGSTRGQGEGGSNGVSQRGSTPASSLVIRRHQSQSISSFSHSGSQHPQDATTTTAARDDEVKPSPGRSSPAMLIDENARAASVFVTSLPFSRHVVAAFATANILKSSTRITSNPPRRERAGGDERGATVDGQRRLTSTALSLEDKRRRTSRRLQVSSFPPADAGGSAGPAAALGHEGSLFVVIVVRHLDEHLAKRRSITTGKQQQRQSLSTSTPSPAAPPTTTSTALPAMLTIHDTMALLAPIGSSGTSYIHGGGGVSIVGGGGGPNLMAASGYMSSSWAANNNNNNPVATTSASTQPSSLAEPQHPFASARSPHHRRLSSSSFQAGTVVTNSVVSPPGIPYSISPTGPVTITAVGEPPTGGAGGPLQEAPVGGPRQIQQPQPRLSFWLPPPMLSVQRPQEPDIVLSLGNVVNDNNRLPAAESALEDVAAVGEGEGDETTMAVVDPFSLGSGSNNNAIYRAAARLELTWSWRDISFTFFDPTTESFYWTITTSWDSVTVDMIFSLAACSLTFIGMIGACLIDGTAHSLFSRTMYDDDCELLGEDPRDYYTLRQPIFWGFIGVGVSWLFIASTMIVFPEHRRIFLKQLLAKMSVVPPLVVEVTASLDQASTAPATTQQHRNSNKNANNTPSSLPRILGFVCSLSNQLIFFLAIAFSTGESSFIYHSQTLWIIIAFVWATHRPLHPSVPMMIFRDAVNSAAILMRTVYLIEESSPLAIYFVAASFPLIVLLRVFRERRRRVGFVLDMMFAYHQEELEHDYQTLETVLKEMVPAGVAGKLVQRVRGERRDGKASPHLNGVVVDDAAGAGEAFFAIESSTSDSSSGDDDSTTSSDENPVGGGGGTDDAASSSDKQTTTTTNNTTTSTMNNPLGGFDSAHNDNAKKKKRRRRRHRGEQQQQQQQRKRKVHPMWSASGNLEMDEVPFLLLQLSTCTTSTTGMTTTDLAARSKEHRGVHRHRLSEPKSRGATPQVQPRGSANSVGGLAFYDDHSMADEGDAHQRSSTNNNSSSTATDDDHANGTDSSGADSEAAEATWGADDYDDGSAAAAAGGSRALDRELNRLSLLAILHDAIPAVFTNEQKRTVQLVQCTHDTAMLVALPQGAGSDDQDELRAFDLLTTAHALFKHLEEYFTSAPNTATTEEVADSPQENAMELLSPKHSGQSQPQPYQQQKRQSSSLSQQRIPRKKLLLPCRMLLDVGGAMGAVLGGRSSVSFGYHGGVVHQAVEALAELPWGTYVGSRRFIELVQQHKTFHNASRDHWNAVTEREPPFFGALFYPKMTPTSPFNDDDWGGKEANLRQAAATATTTTTASAASERILGVRLPISAGAVVRRVMTTAVSDDDDDDDRQVHRIPGTQHFSEEVVHTEGGGVLRINPPGYHLPRSFEWLHF